MELVIKPFGSDEKGFLRRQMKVAKLQKRLESGDVEAMEEMLMMFAERVQGIAKDDAFEALLDLSQDDFEALQKTMLAGDYAPLE